MNDMIKKHWPFLFAILTILISILLAVFAYHSTDTGYAILAFVCSFMFLFPLAGAFIGGWYGWKMQSPWKWLFPPAVFAGVALYLLLANLILQAEAVDGWSYFALGVLPCLACLVTEVIASLIAWIIARRSQ